MNKTRLEAFSDGVFAIIITIMVLELRIPHGATWNDLLPVANIFISYLLSFAFIAIYWVNHHHLLHTVHHVNSKIMWANILLLFWLSIIPFTTGWMGENGFEKMPVCLYAIVLFLCGNAFYILQKTIMAHYTHSTDLTQALKQQQKKGIMSTLLYVLSIFTALVYPMISEIIFVTVAVIWIIPDKNIERALKQES